MSSPVIVWLRRDLRLSEDPDVRERMIKCLEQIYYAKRAVMSAFQSKLSLHQLQAGDVFKIESSVDEQLGSWSLRFRWINNEDTNAVQKLLLHMLDVALEKRYRRHGGWCYEPIVIDGHTTHAWRPVMEIKDWLYSETRKETNWAEWQNLTASANNARTVVEYLTSCSDHSFPELVKDRSTFAFTNGVYSARHDKFYPLGGEEKLSSSIAACKYFPLEFVDHPRGAEIHTPYLDSIMDYQGFAPDVKQWMLIALGRLMYNLNDLDGWQVIPFFKGMASSGKSTVVLKVAKQFYEAIDVGNLSNNIEKNFGLSAFHDKLLFVAPEIKSDLRIEQAEFQSIVSGEDITINVKHKTAFSKTWTVPGVLAGNEVPGWIDNSGSIQRRILLFDFPRPVTNGDMRLGEKLENEMPAIILKCNRAYLEAVRKWGTTNVWTVLPRYFLATRDEMAQATNVLEAFLASQDVVLREGAYVPFDEFKMALKMFAQVNNYKQQSRYTAEFFRGAFDKARITMVRETREYRGRRLKRDYLVGVDLVGGQAENMLG